MPRLSTKLTAPGQWQFGRIWPRALVLVPLALETTRRRGELVSQKHCHPAGRAFAALRLCKKKDSRFGRHAPLDPVEPCRSACPKPAFHAHAPTRCPTRQSACCPQPFSLIRLTARDALPYLCVKVQVSPTACDLSPSIAAWIVPGVAASMVSFRLLYVTGKHFADDHPNF